MASNKRKQDEKHLKMLREMVALPSNKTCFDCHQRGPTYVNMTIGSFVCTSCSGILRGLNPPHRVKSISMASFTPEEMDFLKAHGNELNRKVYLGLYDNRTWPEPDSRDEQRVRDFMVQKYENKRFYVAPTEAMREEARRMNEAALSKQPQTKPLRALLGENATKLVVGNSQTSQTSQNHTPAASTMAAPVKSSVPPPVTAQAQQQPAKPATGGFDLLGDLGSDPFASSAPSTTSSSTGGFADFSSFGSTPAGTPAQPTQPAAPATFPPMSSAPLQPFSGGAGLQPQPANAGTAAPPTSTPTQSSATNFSAISDKYAALADLDSTFNTPTAQSTTVNWGGSEASVGTGIGTNVGSSLNWGGSGSATTGSGDGGAINWGGQSAGSGSGGVGWNSGVPGAGVGGGMPPTSTVTGGGVFGGPASSAANPFGVSSAPAMSQGGQANPFGATSTAGFGQTPGVGFGQPPASSAAGFGYQQYPVQNGGFSMATTAAGYGGFGGMPPSTAPPSYGVAQQQGFQAQPGFPPAQGYPAQQGYGGGWGQMPQQPPSANPFMVGIQPSAPPTNNAFGQS